jgi:hypothetical protein
VAVVVVVAVVVGSPANPAILMFLSACTLARDTREEEYKISDVVSQCKQLSVLLQFHLKVPSISPVKPRRGIHWESLI